MPPNQGCSEIECIELVLAFASCASNGCAPIDRASVSLLLLLLLPPPLLPNHNLQIRLPPAPLCSFSSTS
jgi:hypothetical protein